MSPVADREPIIDPRRVHIAAGWFYMGSYAGQSVEGPVHRVWVDSFAMAATQVTVEEYARFLAPPEASRPHTGPTRISVVLSNLCGGFVV